MKSGSSCSSLASRLKHCNNMIKENHNITLIKFDLKNQFSDLDKARVFQAFKSIIELAKMGEWYLISKKRLEKKRDINRKKNLQNFYVLNAATIQSYVWLELENPYFEIGGKTYL